MTGSCWLLDLVQLAGSGLVDRLAFAGRPADHGFFYLRIFAEAEMQAALILRGETRAPGNLLNLVLAIPE